jgi:hypothetical protein
MNLLKRQHAAELTMFLSRMFAGLLILSLATACGPGVSDMVSIHKRLIQKATTDIPCVKEFHEMCPSAQLLPYFDRRVSILPVATDQVTGLSEQLVFDEPSAVEITHVIVPAFGGCQFRCQR